MGDEITAAPQLLQVKVSYSGARPSDLDACIATLQTGQGFSGICGAAIPLGNWNLGILATTDIYVLDGAVIQKEASY